MTRIQNKARRTLLAQDAFLCKSLWQKAKGLMFSHKDASAVFVFKMPQRVALHNFFVFHALDIVVLDGKKRVIEMRQGFRPFTFYTMKLPAHFVVEVPAGTVAASKTRIGDRIEF